MSLFAKVHKLRTMGALGVGQPPTPSQWARGILEFSTSAGDGERSVPRRLVLRHAQANPMGNRTIARFAGPTHTKKRMQHRMRLAALAMNPI